MAAIAKAVSVIDSASMVLRFFLSDPKIMGIGPMTTAPANFVFCCFRCVIAMRIVARMIMAIPANTKMMPVLKRSSPVAIVAFSVLFCVFVVIYAC